MVGDRAVYSLGPAQIKRTDLGTYRVEDWGGGFTNCVESLGLSSAILSGSRRRLVEHYDLLGVGCGVGEAAKCSAGSCGSRAGARARLGVRRLFGGESSARLQAQPSTASWLPC
jgi:hypothetical protein